MKPYDIDIDNVLEIRYYYLSDETNFKNTECLALLLTFLRLMNMYKTVSVMKLYVVVVFFLFFF